MAPSSSPIICIPTHHHSPSLSVTVNVAIVRRYLSQLMLHVALIMHLFDSLLEQVGV